MMTDAVTIVLDRVPNISKWILDNYSDAPPGTVTTQTVETRSQPLRSLLPGRGTTMPTARIATNHLSTRQHRAAAVVNPPAHAQTYPVETPGITARIPLIHAVNEISIKVLVTPSETDDPPLLTIAAPPAVSFHYEIRSPGPQLAAPAAMFLQDAAATTMDISQDQLNLDEFIIMPDEG